MRALLRQLLRDAVARPRVRDAVVNALAGSFLVSERLRGAILNGAGMQLETRRIGPQCVFTGTAVAIGAGTYVGPRCYFDAGGGASVTIGRDCLVAMDVIFAGMSHALRWPRPNVGGAIVVEDRCWIGAGATLLGGAVIGTGTVVAAGAVVRGTLEPWSVYAGVPARRVRALAPHERAP